LRVILPHSWRGELREKIDRLKKEKKLRIHALRNSADRKRARVLPESGNLFCWGD